MRFSKRLLVVAVALGGLSWFGHSGYAEHRAQPHSINHNAHSAASSPLTPADRRAAGIGLDQRVLLPPAVSRDFLRANLSSVAAVESTPAPSSPPPYEVTPNPVYQYYKPSDFPVVASADVRPVVQGTDDGEDFRGYAFNLVPGQAQQVCLDQLWTAESHWQVASRNHKSGATGIPQALPASKMATAGADYLTNGETQIRWGLAYIKARYSTPCKAWAHEKRYGFY